MIVIAAAGPGSTSIAGSHEVNGAAHLDTAAIDVPDNEWQQPNETTDAFLARLTADHGDDLT